MSIWGSIKNGASPHTRGWTYVSPGDIAGQRGFPAHAGMDPSAPHVAQPRRGLPRTRGDGPEQKFDRGNYE